VEISVFDLKMLFRLEKFAFLIKKFFFLFLQKLQIAQVFLFYFFIFIFP